MKLSDVCYKITDGSHNPPKGIEHSEYLMLSSKNIYDDCITFSEPRYLSEDEFISENRRTNIATNDLLITIVGTVGRVAIVPEEFPNVCLQRSVAVLKLDNDKADSRFMMYQLQNMKSFFETEAHGVAQKGLYLKQLESVKINCPPLETQRKIAANLDKVTHTIDLCNAILEKLDLLVKSRFVEMFGEPVANPYNFPIKTYGALFELNAGGTPSKAKKEYWENGTISWIGSNMCQDSIIYENDGKYITQEGYDNSSAKMFPIDTVLIALVGATIGKTALLKFETSTNQNVLGVRGITDAGYNPLFVYYYTQFLHSKFLNIGDGGFNMASKGFVSELPIYDIAIDYQNQFAIFAEQTDKTKSAVKKLLEKAETLKKALMQEYFG